jgi:hypothetical protein
VSHAVKIRVRQGFTPEPQVKRTIEKIEAERHDSPEHAQAIARAVRDTFGSLYVDVTVEEVQP